MFGILIAEICEKLLTGEIFYLTPRAQLQSKIRDGDLW